MLRFDSILRTSVLVHDANQLRCLASASRSPPLKSLRRDYDKIPRKEEGNGDYMEIEMSREKKVKESERLRTEKEVLKSGEGYASIEVGSGCGAASRTAARRGGRRVYAIETGRSNIGKGIRRVKELNRISHSSHRNSWNGELDQDNQNDDVCLEDGCRTYVRPS